MAAPGVVSEICARCDGTMVAKPDAIGRLRLRCPRCDGVSATRPHPDDAMLPQGLVHLASTLPPVRPGQLRCQRCARGVQGRARFAESCARAKKAAGVEHECGRCHGVIPPRRGRPPKVCDDCLTPAEKRQRERQDEWNRRQRGAA